MTNLLAIDTATDACSLALWLDGKIIERHRIAPRQHARLALPLMNELLLEAGIQLPHLDGFILGAGPGSFTGLRIAAGLVQGLAFGLNLPVVPISTLRTMAQGLYRETGLEKVLVTLDAGMGQVYCGEYALGETDVMQAVEEDRLYTYPPSVPSDHLPSQGGEGAYRGISLPPLRGKVVAPQARYLVDLGYHEFIAGRVVTAEQAQPVYLRPRGGV